MKQNRRNKILVTGAWGAGKTLFIERLKNEKEFRKRILYLPEIGPLTRQTGFCLDSDDFEVYAYQFQTKLEECIENKVNEDDDRILLIHRGTLDILAFWQYSGNKKDDFLKYIDTNYEKEYSKYDCVIFMQSTAIFKESIYNDYSFKYNRPSLKKAKTFEKILLNIWQKHPNFYFIENKKLSWEQRYFLAKSILIAHSGFKKKLNREDLNKQLKNIKYPSNHQYRICSDNHLFFDSKAAKRIQEIETILPKKNWKSFIDICCAKGMFLSWAIKRFHLERAIGIDAAEDMVDISRSVINYLKLPGVVFHGSFQIIQNIIKSADLVFVFHCYHYLYFGSYYGTPGVFSHEDLFGMFSKITKKTLLFANDLEISENFKKILLEKKINDFYIKQYNKNQILQAAEKYFQIQEFDLGGKRKYILMERK
ncbi:AAA family ATPase [Candidatus Harpocratesius sp.]